MSKNIEEDLNNLIKNEVILILYFINYNFYIMRLNYKIILK